MKAIVAVDEKWGIGRGNDMLFRLPADLKRFRKLTTGKAVVMGAKTLLSFPGSKPLPERDNIVLSSSIKREDVIIARNVIKLREILCGYNTDDVFLIGGGSVYEQFIDCCDCAYVTRVFADGDAETFFPCLEGRKGWRKVDCSEEIITNGYTLVYEVYINSEVKKL